MDELWLKVIGWTGQAFFFSRFLVQWLASERARSIVVPRSFWVLSLIGAACAFTYALGRDELVFLAAPTVNLFLYMRNLALQRNGKALDRNALIWVACGVVALVIVAIQLKIDTRLGAFWLALGLIGNLLWIARFPIQWYFSERAGRSTLPAAFFQVSLLGSLLLLAFAIRGGDPVFIAAYALGPFLYGRTTWIAMRQTAPATSR